MGNSLSKHPILLGIEGVRNRRKRGSTLQTGYKTELKARSLGVRLVSRNIILTPASDRFPPQAFDLELDKFRGLISKETPAFRNASVFGSGDRF